MGLSSNTLIHLTTEKESLIKIIQEGFKVKYCAENVQTQTKRITGAFPMICFSDIPLSELKNHITSYGNYGIGLKKEWAKEKGLNPVLYIDNKSLLGSLMNKDFERLLRLANAKDIPEDIFDSLIHIISYAKNYEGKLETAKIKKDNYRFSDEREWRYVPYGNQLLGNESWISEEGYRDSIKKLAANKKLSKVKLSFSPDDINYIFVEKESEISEFIEILRKSNSKSPYESVERLFSRILTTEQIMTDM